jgi:excisionase family DNA binding protein
MTATGPEVIRLNDRQLYRVADAMRLLSLSKTVIYQEMRAGRLRYVTPRSERRIPASAITDYVALLEREAKGVAA